MKYACVKQHDTTDCGAACLSTILKHYGSRMPIAQIRELAGTDKQGTNIYGMVEAAKKLGFDARGVRGDEEALFSDFPLPAIAHVVVDGYLLHYVVIHKITKGKITVTDPAKGIVSYSPKDFLKIWSGAMILITPSDSFVPLKTQQSTFRRFSEMVLSQKKLLLPIFIFSLLITATGILASFYYTIIMDKVLVSASFDFLLAVSLGVLGLYGIKSLLEYFRERLMLSLSQKIDLQLIPQFNKHMLRLPMRFFHMRKSGEIISRYSDASKIRDALADAILTIMIDTLMAIGGGVVLWFQNKTLFLIAFIMLLLYGGVILLFTKPIRKANEKVMEDNSQFVSYLYESVEGIETVKSMNSEATSEKKSRALYDKFWVSIKKIFLLNVSQGTITNTIASIGETMILWVGTISVLEGQMTIGTLITFHALLAYFLIPVKKLLNLQPTMQTAVIATERLNDVLDLNTESDSEQQAVPNNINLCQTINITNLTFRYGTRELVLNSINFSVKPGEKIAFVGESGSGKTTLAKLLLRFYEQETGTITIGSVDIRDIPLHILRDRIAYISQDTFLFSGTIKENLLLAKANATDEEIYEACRLSKADAFIEKMHMGLDSRIEENGSNLSGGQKQRLAIARALLRKPDILIMDEATSNLDSVTEKAIEKTISQMSKDTTLIIIAHRLSTVMQCDTIYVFKEGEIIEKGAHKDLINQNGAYAEFWTEQYGKDE